MAIYRSCELLADALNAMRLLRKNGDPTTYGEVSIGNVASKHTMAIVDQVQRGMMMVSVGMAPKNARTIISRAKPTEYEAIAATMNATVWRVFGYLEESQEVTPNIANEPATNIARY
jgi:hypothetical protein